MRQLTLKLMLVINKNYLILFRQNFRFIILSSFLMSFFGVKTKGQDYNPGYSIGTTSGTYCFSYNQVPADLVEIRPPGVISIAFTYQWQSSLVPDAPENSWTNLSTNAIYHFTQPLQQTTYFRRIATGVGATGVAVSNTIKITIVSANWEDLNYIREHNVITTGVTSWQAVDQLIIGQKLQTTSYLDGLGRPLQKISRETATPVTSNGAWGDMVQFAQYDVMGRQPLNYLPYTTTTAPGKYKLAPLTEQPQYYTAVYNETAAYSSVTFDNSPLNRVKNVKEPGSAWAASAGNSANYDLNTAADNVQIFSVDYIQGNAPVNKGMYPANTLYKIIYTDVNGKQVVEYSNTAGQLILKKIQLADAPAAAYDGWICTYSIYDDFGLLKFQLQPEAVKYLAANSWSFAGANGQTILNEQCFQYNYDDKGRTIWKKAPGAKPLVMLYDIRDRVVFMQDGNQASLATPQWTASLYDDLDRPVITTLYNTSKTITALQADIANSVSTTFTTIAPGAAITDLSVTSRDNNIENYKASNSIVFADGFFSIPADEFIAQIDAAAATPATNITTSLLNNPITAGDLNNSAVTTILKYSYYDNYSFSGVKAFDNGYANTNAYNNSDPNILPITASKRTLNMPTGSMTRVLGTNIFLSATHYFDEKGRQIQTLEENIKSGTDVTTVQYHFDGRVMSSCQNHSAPGTDYTGIITLNKYLFDKLGRVVSLQKKLGENPFKTISSFDYDDIGRLKTKHLDPTYNNLNSGQADLESLNYNFNIHNQIIGINKDYALKASASYNKWGHFFGMYLGFDNRDNTFSQAQLNGQVGGILWNTQGDDAQRKYEFSYDNAGRLINAAFKEQPHPGDGWSNAKMDFSVSGTSGKITYDLNGNLLTMLQKGVMPGTAAPVVVDDLRYAYAAYSNKLQTVTDQMTVSTANGAFGDFKDGSNGAAADYVYDNNGNVVIDLNKNAKDLGNVAGANGIRYNFLDKPDQIRIAGKGTIKVVYDADGAKLQRVFIPDAGGASTITSYINDFVYQETSALTVSSPAPFTGTSPSLAYINFEDGRIRIMQPFTQSNGLDGLSESGNISFPNGKMGAYDYFIMDYQQNVRMILTEETKTAANTATMETSRAGVEAPVFGQTGASNEVEVTRFATPAGWQSVNSSASVSKLGNLAGHTVGPNTLQKVTAGDKITASVQYYFDNPSSSNKPNFAADLLSSLSQAIGGGTAATSIVHNSAANISTQLNGTPAFINAVQPAGSGGTTPQAYLTILFFDERFHFIAAADGGVAQQQVASTWSASNQTLGLASIKAPKNGYAYVYVSNRSDQPVYFDNMLVGNVSGNIIEENHYYAYGLKIIGISSRKLGDANEGKLKNPYQYNGKEMLDEDADLNWLDYGFRNYDPQIGKFPQLDPLTDEYPLLTPFQYASCDPITNIDVDGLEGVGSIGGAAASAGGDFSYAYTAVNSFRSFSGSAVRAASAASTVSSVSKGINVLSLIGSISSSLVHLSTTIGGLINVSMTAAQAGERGGNPYSEGFSDAYWHANSFGLSDLYSNIFGGGPLKEYDSDFEKIAYLKGRLAGDLAALTQAVGETEIGGGIAGGGLALGPGAVIASSAGIAMVAHGTGVGITASADAAWAIAELIKLGVTVKASSKGGVGPNNLGKAGEKATNSDTRSKEKYRGVSGKKRFADKSTETTIEETKNVTYQYWSTQLKDASFHAKNTNRKFVLWVRRSTRLSKEVKRQKKLGNVQIKYIPAID